MLTRRQAVRGAFGFAYDDRKGEREREVSAWAFNS